MIDFTTGALPYERLGRRIDGSGETVADEHLGLGSVSYAGPLSEDGWYEMALSIGLDKQPPHQATQAKIEELLSEAATLKAKLRAELIEAAKQHCRRAATKQPMLKAISGGRR